MTQPSTIASRFLSHPHQLGVVAVGFNGGQVWKLDLGHETIPMYQNAKKLHNR